METGRTAIGIVVFAALASLAALAACRAGTSPRVAGEGSAAVEPTAGEAGGAGAADAEEPGDAAEAASPLDATETPPAIVVNTIEEYRQAIRPIACERELRCGSIGRSQLAACIADSDTARPDFVFGTWEELEIDAEIAAGRLVFDAETANACLGFWRGAACRIPIEWAFRCRGYWPPFRPGVEPGGRCARWEECIDGYCGAQPGCEGTCIARSPTGGTCGSNAICLERDFCENGVCVPRRVEGESCPGAYDACREEFFCEGWMPENDDIEWYRPEVPGTCAARKGPGTPCTGERSDHVCRSDLFCDWGDPQPACRERLGRDAECRWLDGCADGLVCRGLKLGGRHPMGNRYGVLEPGRCVPFLDAGDDCDPDANVDGCPATMRCHPDERKCRPSGREGDPCESSWVPPGTPDDRPIRRNGCRGSLYCDPETRRCREALSFGDRCTRADLEDEPCFLGRCDERTRRCVRLCDPR